MLCLVLGAVLQVGKAQRARVQLVLRCIGGARDHTSVELRVLTHVHIKAARARHEAGLLTDALVVGVDLVARQPDAARGTTAWPKRNAHTAARTALLAMVRVSVLWARDGQVAANVDDDLAAAGLCAIQRRVAARAHGERVGCRDVCIDVRDGVAIGITAGALGGGKDRDAGLLAERQPHARAEAAAAVGTLLLRGGLRRCEQHIVVGGE